MDLIKYQFCWSNPSIWATNEESTQLRLNIPFQLNMMGVKGSLFPLYFYHKTSNIVLIIHKSHQDAMISQRELISQTKHYSLQVKCSRIQTPKHLTSRTRQYQDCHFQEQAQNSLVKQVKIKFINIKDQAQRTLIPRTYSIFMIKITRP